MQRTLTLVSPILAAGLLLGVAVAQQSSGSASQPSSQTSSGQASSAQGSSTKSTSKTGTSAAKKPSARTAPLVLKTDREKESYAMGMNLGTGLHRQGMMLDPALVARGIRDAQNGGKTLLTEEEAHEALTKLQGEVREKLESKSKGEDTSNRKAGEEFLAANKSKPGVVTLPSGLQYKILKEGTGPKPTADDTVSCEYKGTLIDGKEFDSSAKHGGPATFPVSGVIKGWTEALQLMPVGSKWELFIPADLAYGDRGAGADIQPGDTLIFDVELVSIGEKKGESK
ncbi:MAG TPA: FKBP-type peptidyl-prolyl cis-trans isomerase [Verrucomicrobiae bacterium]|jgi:FKBP-type peptidyl-prolyl cis-trans isomerase FklB|nr:FKBP-type peptidyl-prolyl cis-trans isomerase [Verrucomicrobiae bacterium]